MENLAQSAPPHPLLEGEGALRVQSLHRNFTSHAPSSSRTDRAYIFVLGYPGDVRRREHRTLAHGRRAAAGHRGHVIPIRPPFAHRRLRHMRQEILKIRIRRSHDYKVRKLPLERTRHLHLPCNSHQRVLWRQISVGRRVERWPLDVRIVVRTSRRDVHQLNSKFLQQQQESLRFAQVAVRRVSADSHRTPNDKESDLPASRRLRRKACRQRAGSGETAPCRSPTSAPQCAIRERANEFPAPLPAENACARQSRRRNAPLGCMRSEIRARGIRGNA